MTVLTLDAGGTNFVFSAVTDGELVCEPIRKRAESRDLEKCIQTLIDGFNEVKHILQTDIDAISFAFPGPADYNLGIIGNLPNFEAFNDHVPLGPILEHHFGLPVFIKNDGDLFAFGEASEGYLPYLNSLLTESGSTKQYKNLIGLTLGTGVGGGIVINGQLLEGDNSCSAEIHNSLNSFNPDWACEESISTRAIQRVYADQANEKFDRELLPGMIYEIAKGEKSGDQAAAIASFEQFGRAIGNTICNLVTFIDGIVVLGGGIVAGWDLYKGYVFEEINKKFENPFGKPFSRLTAKIYDLSEKDQMQQFLEGKKMKLAIPGTDKGIEFDSEARVGIAHSRLGSSEAIMKGAYAYAVSALENNP
ncbi:MAG: ROK family protein [Marinoscillum sp.]